MQTLELMQLPLHGTSLIEASAGTGKTYTIAALYLRLVLGHGVAAPLSPEQILVVTFTDAATCELKSRIQQRLLQAAAVFNGELAATDPVLVDLTEAYPQSQWPTLAQRLQLAAQGMDEAAVSTIHGFCQRMLTEHAFAAGSQFEQELTGDQHSLQLQVVMDYWRSHIYALSQPLLRSYQRRFSAPSQLLSQLLPLWRGDLQLAAAPAVPVAQLLGDELTEREAQLARLKAPWQQWLDEIAQIIEAGRAAGQTNNSKLRADYVASWLSSLKTWRDDPTLVEPKAGKWQERLTPEGIAEAWKGAAPTHPAFDAIAALPKALAALSDCSFALRLHALDWVQTRFRQRQSQLAQQGFDDLLSQLAGALLSSQGEHLAALIRAQFPQALIDEFQDTDYCQWQIFSRIYQPEAQRQDCNLLLIGDPKQAIYSFRGADIYTYLVAKQQTQGRHFSLDTNFRSSTALVSAVNQLFMQAETRTDGAGAFLFRQQGDYAAEGENAAEGLPFRPVAANGRAETLVRHGQPLPAFCWQILPFGDKTPSKSHYLQQAAEQAANHIVGLLQDAALQHCGFAKDGLLQALQTGDIAVLVNNQQEANLMRRALASRGIASVYLSDKGTVFDSPLANELLLWLRACSAPRDAAALRAALASPALALPYADLLALSDDEWLLEARQQQFLKYQQLWRDRGILAMLHRFLQDFDLISQLSQRSDAERLLTDLFHLAELMQQASRELEGEAALLRYLQQQLQQADDSEPDAVRLRLESDESLVRIVTIHKSKGLEYPLVLLPFLCAARELDPRRLPYLWHDKQGKLQLAERFDEVSFERAEQERLAEDLRKLYVALTRARHHCWVALMPQADRSALAYLLDSSAVLPADVQSVLSPFSQAPLFACVSAEAQTAPVLPSIGSLALASVSTAESEPSGYRLDAPAPRERWQMSSYSGLLHATQSADAMDSPQWAEALANKLAEPLQQDQAVANGSASVGQAGDMTTAIAAAPTTALPINTVAPSFAATFRKGATIGTFLHEQLEWAAEQGFALVCQQPALLTAQLVQSMQQHGLLQQRPDGRWQRQLLQEELTRPQLFAEASDATTQLQHWLLALLHSELPAVGALAALDTYRAELEFLLPAQRVDIALLDQLVCAKWQAGEPRPALSVRQLNGMLKGFIDLSLCQHQRYYVLDFKSNAQAEQRYEPAALWPMMLEHRYDLQAALYLIAMHRLLTQRLAGYQISHHLGGALYWFLRGAEQADAGCLLLTVNEPWLLALDALFSGDNSLAKRWLAAQSASTVAAESTKEAH